MSILCGGYACGKAVYFKNNTEQDIELKYALEENGHGHAITVPVAPREISMVFDDVNMLSYLNYDVTGGGEHSSISVEDDLQQRKPEQDKTVLVTVNMRIDKQEHVETGWMGYASSAGIAKNYNISYYHRISDYENEGIFQNVTNNVNALVQKVFGGDTC